HPDRDRDRRCPRGRPRAVRRGVGRQADDPRCRRRDRRGVPLRADRHARARQARPRGDQGDPAHARAGRAAVMNPRIPMRALLISILLFGCGAPQVRPENDLSESIRIFNDGVRWERFAAAASSIPPKQRSQFVDEMDQRAGDLKITDYEIVNVDSRGERAARVQIKLSWYKASEGTVHETHAIQTWERHGQIWMMVDESRLRGAEMPGLGEPVMKD